MTLRVAKQERGPIDVGRCFATLCNALRIVLASKEIGLEVNASKCCVMAPSRYKAAMDKLLRPLRRGEVGCWRVVKSITILGVALSDPTNKEELQKAVRKALKERVVSAEQRAARGCEEVHRAMGVAPMDSSWPGLSCADGGPACGSRRVA